MKKIKKILMALAICSVSLIAVGCSSKSDNDNNNKIIIQIIIKKKKIQYQLKNFQIKF